MINVIPTALLPVVVTLGLGMLAGWHRDHDVRSAKSLNRMVLVYALPLALFAGTVTIPRPELISDWPLLAAMVAGTVLPFAAALLVNLYLVHRSLEAAALQAMVFGMPAIAFTGLAILTPLIGSKATVVVDFAGLTANILILPATLVLLAFAQAGGGAGSYVQARLPAFEKATGACVLTVPGPSIGTTKHAIPHRLARGEAADVLVMVGPALDELAQKGEVVPGSEVELALSPIGMAVRAGDPVPDIGTEDRFRQALLDAKSIAYSDSSSGAYISTKLFKKLGIEKEMQGKARQIPATPVGEVVAKGEAGIGFQEVAELLPVPGITFVGRIPAEDEFLTRFSAAVASRSKNPALAKQLIAHLAAPSARPVLERVGLEPPKT